MVSEKTLTKDESKKIQLLRGLSIIAVVCIHNTPDGMVQAWCRPFLNFAVAMFLFISGMLSNSKNWKPVHRLKKIIVPYFLWSIIYTVLSIVIDKCNVLQYLGRISLVILCIHGPVYRIIVKLVSVPLHMGTDAVRENVILAMIVVAMTLVVCSVAYEAIRRICPWMIGKRVDEYIKGKEKRKV